MRRSFDPLDAPSGAFIRFAHLSDCRQYRWHLWRVWNPERGFVVFIGLNPSTADETADDATIRKCVAYARRWGYGGLCMLNLYAWRDRHPSGLALAADPVGALNDRVLQFLTAGADLTVCAWGADKAVSGRGEAVRELLGGRGLHALKITSGGHPGHPLYLPGDLEPTLWT